MALLKVSVVVQVECCPERQHDDCVDNKEDGSNLPVFPES